MSDEHRKTPFLLIERIKAWAISKFAPKYHGGWDADKVGDVAIVDNPDRFYTPGNFRLSGINSLTPWLPNELKGILGPNSNADGGLFITGSPMTGGNSGEIVQYLSCNNHRYARMVDSLQPDGTPNWSSWDNLKKPPEYVPPGPGDRLGLGLTGESWRTYSSTQRKSDETYTAPDYPISVMVTTGDWVSHSIKAYVNGRLISSFNANSRKDVKSAFVSFIVPAKTSYRVIHNAPLKQWAELR